MNHIMHWLAWDIRRFHWLLSGWIVAVTIHMWMVFYFIMATGHAHVQPVRLLLRPEMIGYSGLLTAGQMLGSLWILGSDPALGPGAFWKTKPPRGVSIASAKLVLVTVWFFLFPLVALLVAWLTAAMIRVGLEEFVAAAVNSEGPGGGWTRGVGFFILLECRLLGGLLLAAAVVRFAGQCFTNLILGTGGGWVLLMAGFLALAPERSALETGPEAFVITSLLWAAAGAVVYGLGRSRSSPGEVRRPLTLLVPLALMIAALLLDNLIEDYQRAGTPAARTTQTPVQPD